jgi:Kdo2-lipid IVA lauroyltransferase/acyltransferase
MTDNSKAVDWLLNAGNIASIGILKGLSYMPFWFLYGLSDLIAILLQYVFRYRGKVIVENLELSFPEKSKKEIKTIVRIFYLHLADVMMETLKGYSMSWESCQKRITVLGTEVMNDYYEKGKSILCFGMHYNNFEWNTMDQPFLKHQILLVYNPMRNNPLFEEYLLKIRGKWGTQSIPVHKSGRAVLEFHLKTIPVCLALAADQRPPAITSFWTTFFNQEACFNSGIVKIARKTNQPIFINLMRKVKRGHYEISFIPLIENPASLSDEEILLTYVRTMEKFIREAPGYYLWSHRRWAQKRPEGYEIYKGEG